MKKPNWKIKCKDQAETIEKLLKWRMPEESTKDWLKRTSKQDFIQKKELDREKKEIERLNERSSDTLMIIDSNLFNIGFYRGEIEFLYLFLKDDIFKLKYYKNNTIELLNEKIFVESKKYSYLFINDRIYFFILEKALDISKRLKEEIDFFAKNTWDGLSPNFILQSKALALASQNTEMIDEYVKTIKRYHSQSE